MEHQLGGEVGRMAKDSVSALSLQWCLTLCDPMDCSPPGSSVHGLPCPPPGDLPYRGLNLYLLCLLLCRQIFAAEPSGKPKDSGL